MITQAIKAVTRYLPDNFAFSVTTRLAARLVKLPLKERDCKALAQGRRFTFGSPKLRVGWSWGEGPTVVLVHGWGGRAAQMAPLAMRIASLGFRAIAFDATAHGESAGGRISFRNFVTDVGDLANFLKQDVYAYVCHSAGGLCTMAARKLIGIQASYYVCLNAPRAPYPPVKSIRRQLNPPPSLLRRYQDHFAAQFDNSWETLDSGAAFTYAHQGELMLVYDENDERVEHTDGDKISKLWPSATLIKTKGLGHQKILWSPEVIESIANFLQPD